MAEIRVCDYCNQELKSSEPYFIIERHYLIGGVIGFGVRPKFPADLHERCIVPFMQEYIQEQVQKQQEQATANPPRSRKRWWQ